MIHYSYSIMDTTWFQLFVLLSTFLAKKKEKKVLDVMQDKGHNTAKLPTFEIMSPGNHAFKSLKNIKS